MTPAQEAFRSPAGLPAEKRTMSRERIVHEVGEWQVKAGWFSAVKRTIKLP